MRVDSQDAHEDDHHKVVLKIVQGYDDEGDDWTELSRSRVYQKLQINTLKQKVCSYCIPV